jgi:hypothetical protein
MGVVSNIKGRAQTEGVREQGAEKNIWTEGGCSNRRMEKVAQWGES